MILRSPPQFGQCSMSISTTRLSRPAQANRSVVRAVRLALGGWRGLRGRLSLSRHHLRAQLGVGSQHTMEADQVQSRAWHQRCKPLHELQRPVNAAPANAVQDQAVKDKCSSWRPSQSAESE